MIGAALGNTVNAITKWQVCPYNVSIYFDRKFSHQHVSEDTGCETSTLLTVHILSRIRTSILLAFDNHIAKNLNIDSTGC